MNKIYTTIPADHAECPVCNGTGRVPAPEELKRYASVIAYYDKTNDTIRCRNCGGQYMMGRSRGYVKLDNQGQPCQHQYVSNIESRCLTRYTCSQCGDRHFIDSSD